ncbi:hypothetical protein [Microtetraspora malaysiensis]|uniref:hypothetical protein n=1 Tax=Microtetraspora malaysiensis TaxID=161358 RepID=UPI003D94281D
MKDFVVELVGNIAVGLVGFAVIFGLATLFRWSVPDLPEIVYFLIGMTVLLATGIPIVWLARRIKRSLQGDLDTPRDSSGDDA